MNDTQNNEDDADGRDNRLIDEYVQQDRNTVLQSMRDLTRSSQMPTGTFPRADQIIFFDNNVHHLNTQIFYSTVRKARFGSIELSVFGSPQPKKSLMFCHENSEWIRQSKDASKASFDCQIGKPLTNC